MINKNSLIALIFISAVAYSADSIEIAANLFTEEVMIQCAYGPTSNILLAIQHGDGT